MFKFEFVFATFAEAQQAMALLSASPAVDPVAKAEVVAEVKAEIKARTEKAKATPAPKPAATPPVSETATPAQAPEPVQPEPAAASPSEPAKSITLEEVRAKLAALSQAGKAPAVKALIAGAGFAKLTDIPADQYTDILEKAAAL